jgi:predicted DNA-binding WGR domain protein
MGWEVFSPKIIPTDPDYRSGVVTNEYDTSLTTAERANPPPQASYTIRIVYQVTPPAPHRNPHFPGPGAPPSRRESAPRDPLAGESRPFTANHPMVELLQFPLFPDQAALIRIRPDRNEWRYYRLAVWPDLFGRALLARQWGRIGTQGCVRLDPHPDAGAAVNALARLAHAKRRRGYRDRPW